jgi:RimJ/RimL family protein N-acetyltransferase
MRAQIGCEFRWSSNLTQSKRDNQPKESAQMRRWTQAAPTVIIALVRLRTPRLVLRPFRLADADAFATFAETEAYLRFLGQGHPSPTDFVANNMGKEGAWVIELDEQVVGSIFLDDELAYLLDPAVHGRGIATEAARTVITDGFARRGYGEVLARSHPNNIASVRVLERLGFNLSADGMYRLDREDWAPP